MPIPVLLKIDMVARLLSVSPKTIYGWIKRGEIDAVLLPGGGKRIRKTTVEEILGMEEGELRVSDH